MHAINMLVGVASIMLVAWYAGRILLHSAKALRQGTNRLVVGAALTTNLIGLAAGIGAAVAGAACTARLLNATPDVANVLGQVAGGFLTSWIASAVYYRWICGPIWSWFVGDEVASHGS